MYLLLCLVLVAPAKTDQMPEVDTARAMENRIVSTDPERTNEAIVYYQKLTSPLMTFKQANYDYVKAMTRVRKAKAIEKNRQEMLNVIQRLKEHVQKVGGIKNDDTLVAELNRYLDMTDIVLKKDFGKIVDMEDIEARSYDQEEAHQLAIDMAVEKLNSTYRILRAAEKTYFVKYEINSNDTTDELSRKIERANRAMEYYNVLYRIFAKVNRVDGYARKAVGEKDIAALEQHIATLVAFADEGIAAIGQIAGYEGDNELVTAARSLLEFYKKEGEETYPANVAFYLGSDRFQSAGKKFNAIRGSDRKQADVDEYNKAVNAFNKSVTTINKINQVSFKKQKQAVDTWNRQMGRFFDKHS